tara:strand:- start:5125 stop:5604 length:480 start_codon:yes stop_codon:yes gene_type:complete
MATSTPFREDILGDVVTQLQTIDTTSYRSNITSAKVSRLLKDLTGMDTEDFPALFVSDGVEEIIPQTNDQMEAKFNVIITGYVRFNVDADSANSPSVQLNKLIADCKEVLMDTTSGLWTNREVFISSVETDEGFLEPDAVFRMTAIVTYHYSATNTGSV